MILRARFWSGLTLLQRRGRCRRAIGMTPEQVPLSRWPLPAFDATMRSTVARRQLIRRNSRSGTVSLHLKTHKERQHYYENARRIRLLWQIGAQLGKYNPTHRSDQRP